MDDDDCGFFDEYDYDGDGACAAVCRLQSASHLILRAVAEGSASLMN